MFNLIFSIQKFSDLGLLALRLAIGAVFLIHGKQKLAMWKMPPSPQMPAPMLGVMKLLSIAEPLGGLALIFGFFSQLAALGLAIIMLGAIYFKKMVWKTPFTAMDKMGWEFDLVILAGAIALIINGGGVVSLDRQLFGL